MSQDSTLDNLKKQRRRAVFNLASYFVWAVPGMIYFTALCGSASDIRVLNVFFLGLTLAVLGAVHRSKKVDAANAKLKQYHRQQQQRGFRLQDEYPPQQAQQSINR